MNAAQTSAIASEHGGDGAQIHRAMLTRPGPSSSAGQDLPRMARSMVPAMLGDA